MHRLRHLQPHVPAGLLRRPRGGVLRAQQRRDALGRGRRADGRGQRPRRRSADRHAHLPRPDEVRGGPGQVHAGDRPGRRHRERPRPAARREGQVVDAARGLRRRPLRPGRPRELRAGRTGHAARRPPGAGAGTEGRQDAPEAGGGPDPRPQVLLVRLVRDPGHPGRDQPDRMDRDPRVRGQPAGLQPRRRALGRHPQGRRGVQHPADRAVRGAADRGRHLQLRLGHHARPTRRST